MRLKKALYGLKQGPRGWNHTLVTFLTERLGSHQLLSEQSVFTRGIGDQYIAITVHVDDQSIISPNEGLIKGLKARLKIEYGITDLGILSYSLGLKVKWMTNGSVLFSQKKYARTVHARFHEFLPGKSNVPMDPTDRPKLSATTGPTTRAGKAIVANPPYGRLLMYLVVSTRPDVALAFSRLSNFLQNPGKITGGQH